MDARWMTDTLADMEKFAELNGMEELRLQLARCRELAGETQGEQRTETSGPSRKR